MPDVFTLVWGDMRITVSDNWEAEFVSRSELEAVCVMLLLFAFAKVDDVSLTLSAFAAVASSSSSK